MKPDVSRRGWLPVALAATSICLALTVLSHSREGDEIPPPKTEPRLVDPGPPGGPPSDAIVLFDGKDLSKWHGRDGSPAPWVVEDGAMVVKPKTGDISTRESFGDVQLHIEWATPGEIKGEGQGRGNSGVFLMSRYELQILDSYQNPTYFHGQAGAIYKQYAPLVNASRKPGEWQTYDIIFRAPRFDSNGKLLEPAMMTAFHNGVLIQYHEEIKGTTTHVGAPKYEPHPPEQPLRLQDHGDLVRFRNIWIRRLQPRDT
jgi:hypothetical protein